MSGASQKKRVKKSSSQSLINLEEDDGKSQGVTQRMNLDEVERKVQEMIRFMLFTDKKKIGMKRSDLVKNILKEQSKAFPTIIKEVSTRLSDVFGYSLVEMITKDGKGRGYILINNIDKHFEDEISTLLDTDDESSHMGLLVIVLSLIFMNGHPITEVSLWHTLNKFGLHKDHEHEVFGNVDRLLSTDFVKQNYLERQKIQGPDGPTWQYDIGPRSVKEVGMRRVLQFVSEVYGVDAIEDWKSQYQQVLEEENEGVQMDTSE